MEIRRVESGKWDYRPLLLHGDVPGCTQQDTGCVFQGRCPHATAACRQVPPEMKTVGRDHQVLCNLVSSV